MRLSRQRKVKVLDQGSPRDLRGCGQIDAVPLGRVLDAALEEAGAAAAHFPVAEGAVPCSVRARRVPRMVGAATRRAPSLLPSYDSGVFARDPHVLRRCGWERNLEPLSSSLTSAPPAPAWGGVTEGFE